MPEDTNRIINVGVFGVGSLGQHHARVYSEMEGVNLAGIFDVDADRAREIANAHGTEPFTDLEALGAKIEAASIVVPTDRHWEVFGKLKDHSVHMLMEKPIAARIEEAEQMVAAARDTGLLLQIGHIERFNPVMQFLEDNFKEPTFIEATRLAPYPPQRPGLHPRGTEVSVVLDLMIHDLDIVLSIVRSPIKELHATGSSILSPSEDIANARLLFEDGCVANLTASRISLDRMRRIQIFQDDAYAVLDYNDQSGKLVRKGATDMQVEDIPVNKGDALTAELSSFIDSVRHNKEPVVSGEHGAEALKLAIDICRLIATNPS